MKKLFTSIMAVCGMYMAMAQAPEIEWEKALGSWAIERAQSIIQTNDGGYIIAGYSNSPDGDDVSGNHGGLDYWIVKLGDIGNIEWQKSFGGSNLDQAYSIQQTADDGYIIAGTTKSNDGDITAYFGSTDVWIIKLDNSGSLEWEKSYGGIGSEVANEIIQTTEGGYIVAGSATYDDGDVSGHHGSTNLPDSWIFKLDSVGNLLWQKMLGGSGAEEAYSIRQTADEGYVIAGYSNSDDDGDVSGYHGGAGDYWIVKLDNTGNIEWQKCLGGAEQDVAYAMDLTLDGGYIMTGSSRSDDGDVSGHHGNSGSFDYWVVKLDNTGNIEWQKSLGGSGSEIAYSIEHTIDGGYFIAGYAHSNDGDVTLNYGNLDYWVVRLDEAGDVIWQKSLGGSFMDIAFSGRQTADGGYIIAGLAESEDGQVTNHHTGNGYNADYWIVKLMSDTMSVTDQQFSQFEIYPNPAKETVNFSKAIDGELFNSAGQKVMTIRNAKSVNVSGLAKGVYVLKISEGITKKLMVK